MPPRSHRCCCEGSRLRRMRLCVNSAPPSPPCRTLWSSKYMLDRYLTCIHTYIPKFLGTYETQKRCCVIHILPNKTRSLTKRLGLRAGGQDLPIDLRSPVPYHDPDTLSKQGKCGKCRELEVRRQSPYKGIDVSTSNLILVTFAKRRCRSMRVDLQLQAPSLFARSGGNFQRSGQLASSRKKRPMAVLCSV